MQFTSFLDKSKSVEVQQENTSTVNLWDFDKLGSLSFNKSQNLNSWLLNQKDKKKKKQLPVVDVTHQKINFIVNFSGFYNN